MMTEEKQEYAVQDMLDMYTKECISMKDIAIKVGISINRVRGILTTNGVTIRKSGPNTHISRIKYIKSRYGKDTLGNHWDANWLRQQYVEEKKPITQIAKECGISRQRISVLMYRAGIFVKGQVHAKNRIKKEVQSETNSSTCE